MPDRKINIENARTENQRSTMKQIAEDGVCPFCRENFETYHPKPILFETDHWVVTENAWPYENTKKHFLLVTKTHVTKPSELTQEMWSGLHTCITQLEENHAAEHGTLLIRFGESEHTGATVDHLHAQIVIAQSKETPVVTRVG